LDNITGGTTGQVLILRIAATEDITVRHKQGGTGEIRLDGGTNLKLDTTVDRLVLHYDADLGSGIWSEIGRMAQ